MSSGLVGFVNYSNLKRSWQKGCSTLAIFIPSLH